MRAEKFYLKNRQGLKIAVLVEFNNDAKGLAFVMHGLGGFKEQDHIRIFSQAFLEEGCTVVRFDTTNTLGESDGNYEDATTTNYFHDLEDVIVWARKQEWYQQPFWLCGHSLGGIATILYAEEYPERVKGLAPISTVVSGKLSLTSARYQGNDVLQGWQETGWKIEKSSSRPGVIKRLKWSHMEDRMKYDVLEEVDNLTMPVLMIVGSEDETTPLKHQQILFDKLPGKKELHIIKDALHTFRDEKQLAEIKTIMVNWIRKVQHGFSTDYL